VLVLPDELDVLERLVAWGEAQPSIRAMIVTSSRARADSRADVLSDYDVIVVARDAAALAANDVWASEYGEPLVRWGDQDELYGLTTYFRGVVYEDGVKIDYTLWPDALLERVSGQATLPEELDGGYRILLDKDGWTSGWQTPTYGAHVPAKPTEAE
jgi:aminoglycoside 6-adenylyltransferase